MEVLKMKTFQTLAQVVEYIKEGEDVKNYRWNNAAGDWDIDDILCNAAMYDENYSSYTVDIITYDIYDENYMDGEILFSRIEDKID